MNLVLLTHLSLSLISAVAFTPSFKGSSLSFVSLHKQGALFSLSTNDDRVNGADTNTVIKTDSFIATKSSNLDKNLTSDERSIVNIVRARSPSVACVTSYAIPARSSTNTRRRDRSQTPAVPPAGSTSLATGSAFSVTSDGYLLTNYHVIERAYQMQQSSIQLESFYKNITQKIPFQLLKPPQPTRKAQVYIQLDSSRDNLPCRIVDVKPENDIAILQLNNTFLESTKFSIPPPIPDGLSTDLLVGQNVLAIGNPFGLSQTVTTGVVSALDRSVKGIAGNDIRGCIQTDASINPGNSGGPLLNSNGQVVGVNTMIISTSGSSAGIGFAVPVDGFWSAVMDLIDDDRIDQRLKNKDGADGIIRKRGWLGLKIVLDSNLEIALSRRMGLDSENMEGVFVMDVDDGSPALEAGVAPLKIINGSAEIGDRIVAVNGQLIADSKDLKREIKDRVVGENITMTVMNEQGEKRVVYITMKEKP
jgi:S1-C subfamily serine protease